MLFSPPNSFHWTTNLISFPPHKKQNSQPRNGCRDSSVKRTVQKACQSQSHKSRASRFLVAVAHESGDACRHAPRCLSSLSTAGMPGPQLMKPNNANKRSEKRVETIIESLPICRCLCLARRKRSIADEEGRKKGRVARGFTESRSCQRKGKGDSDQPTVAALRALTPVDTLRFSIDSLFYNRRDIVQRPTSDETESRALQPPRNQLTPFSSPGKDVIDFRLCGRMNRLIDFSWWFSILGF